MKKSITEYPITRLLLLFEQDLYRLFDNVSKKYKYTLTQQTLDQAGYAKRLLVKCLDIPKEMTTEMAKAKYHMIAESRSELRVLEINLCQLNDLGEISKEVKKRLDEALRDLYLNFDRLLISLQAKVPKCGGTESQGCAPGSVPAIVGTPDCDR
jgi:hypothetical protein